MIILTLWDVWKRMRMIGNVQTQGGSEFIFLAAACKSPQSSPFIRSIDNTQVHWQMPALPSATVTTVAR